MNGTVITSVQQMQAVASEVRSGGKTIGLVPTMGALHEGHLALIRRATEVADWVVTSIFVNPTQFGPGEDFDRYPRDLDQDAPFAFEAGSHVVFTPNTSELYPAGFQTFVVPGKIGESFEGSIRPGHFRGVATVVAKLINITTADIAVFGQKDVQQAFVLRRMARDLNMNVTVLVEPTVREPDGLAMSSRNRYLSPDERSRASCLSRALKVAERSLQAGERSAENLRRALAIEIEKASPTEIDYIAVLNPETFEPEDPIGSASVLVTLAVRFGSTRLIDNSIIRLAENQENPRPSGGS